MKNLDCNHIKIFNNLKIIGEEKIFFFKSKKIIQYLLVLYPNKLISTNRIRVLLKLKFFC